MQPENNTTATTPKAMLWAGRILSGLAGAFFLFVGGMMLLKAENSVKGLSDFGYPENGIVPLGLAVTVSAVLYLFPRTAVLGAILLTGYLGGAVATHVRANDGMFFFPVIFGALVWLGLVLRDARLRSLLPWRTG